SELHRIQTGNGQREPGLFERRCMAADTAVDMQLLQPIIGGRASAQFERFLLVAQSGINRLQLQNGCVGAAAQAELDAGLPDVYVVERLAQRGQLLPPIPIPELVWL